MKSHTRLGWVSKTRILELSMNFLKTRIEAYNTSSYCEQMLGRSQNLEASLHHLNIQFTADKMSDSDGVTACGTPLTSLN